MREHPPITDCAFGYYLTTCSRVSVEHEDENEATNLTIAREVPMQIRENFDDLAILLLLALSWFKKGVRWK